MKSLTKAEEQLMQALWKLEKGFLKDIIDALPDPKPAYPTVSTVIRVMVQKGFVGYRTYGKSREYYPLIEKKAYFNTHFRGMVKNFFGSSWKGFAAFFAKDSELTLEELQEIREVIDQQIEDKKKHE